MKFRVRTDPVQSIGSVVILYYSPFMRSNIHNESLINSVPGPQKILFCCTLRFAWWRGSIGVQVMGKVNPSRHQIPGDITMFVLSLCVKSKYVRNLSAVMHAQVWTGSLRWILFEQVTPDRNTQFGCDYCLSLTPAFKDVVTDYGTESFELVSFQREEKTIVWICWNRLDPIRTAKRWNIRIFRK